MSFKIDISGNVKDIIQKRTRRLMDDIADEVNAFGQGVVNDAKRLAPVDEGNLRESISFSKIVNKGSISVEISVASNYAAYIEFGTRKFADKYVSTLPKEWKDFAATFKGPGGGSFDEFVMSLVRWVRLKKIGATYNVQTKKRDRVGKQSAATTAYADAYAIALYIIRNGIRPQPFLFPSVEKNRIKLIANLKALK